MAYYKAITNQKQRSRLAYLLTTSLQADGVQGEIRHIAGRLLSDVHGAENLIDGFFRDQEDRAEAAEKAKVEAWAKDTPMPKASTPPAANTGFAGEWELKCSHVDVKELENVKNYARTYHTEYLCTGRTYVKCRATTSVPPGEYYGVTTYHPGQKTVEVTIYVGSNKVARLCDINPGDAAFDGQIYVLVAKVLSWWVQTQIIDTYQRTKANAEQRFWSTIVGMKHNA